MTLRFLMALMVSVLAFGAPLIALAHSQAVWKPYWGPLLSCTGNYANPAGKAPVTSGADVDGDGTPDGVTDLCRSFCDILHTFQHIVQFALTIAFFVILRVGLAIGTGMLIFSGGSPEMVSQGGQVLKGMGVGTGLVLIVYVVVMTMIYGLDATRQLQGGIGPGLHWGAITC